MPIENAMDRLVRVRKHRNISQHQIADLLGITQASWGRKETGTIHGFSLPDIQKIIDFLQVDARWIFGQIECSLEDALLDYQKLTPSGNIIEDNALEYINTKSAEIALKLHQFDEILKRQEVERTELHKEITTLKNEIKKEIKEELQRN